MTALASVLFCTRGVPQAAALADPPRCHYLLALVTLIRLLNIISVKTSDGT